MLFYIAIPLGSVTENAWNQVCLSGPLKCFDIQSSLCLGVMETVFIVEKHTHLLSKPASVT